MPQNDNEVGPLEQPQMFGNGLSGNIEVSTEFTEGLGIVAVQLIEQSAAAGISERLEDFIHRTNMQPNGCMSTGRLSEGSGAGRNASRAVRAPLFLQVKGARPEIDDAMVLAEDL